MNGEFNFPRMPGTRNRHGQAHYHRLRLEAGGEESSNRIGGRHGVGAPCALSVVTRTYQPL